MMIDKQQFIADWLKDNPDDDASDAMDAWLASLSDEQIIQLINNQNAS